MDPQEWIRHPEVFQIICHGGKGKCGPLYIQTQQHTRQVYFRSRGSGGFTVDTLGSVKPYLCLSAFHILTGLLCRIKEDIPVILSILNWPRRTRYSQHTQVPHRCFGRSSDRLGILSPWPVFHLVFRSLALIARPLKPWLRAGAFQIEVIPTLLKASKSSSPKVYHPTWNACFAWCESIEL